MLEYIYFLWPFVNLSIGTSALELELELEIGIRIDIRNDFISRSISSTGSKLSRVVGNLGWEGPTQIKSVIIPFSQGL